MGTTSRILIQEDATALFFLMKQYQPSRQRTRVQALYLLKSGKAASITHASRLLGYSRKTVQRWLHQYQCEGLQGLLAMRHGGGRPAGVPLWAQTKLKARLNQPRGFVSYGEIVTWLASQQALSHQLTQLTRSALRSLTLRQTLLETFSYAGQLGQAA